MNIRDADLHDLPQLSTLFDLYRQFYAKESDVKAAEHFLKARIQHNESEIYVAEDDDKTLLGFTQLYPLFSSTRMQRYWLLNDLFVHADHRGKGAALQLIGRAKQLCRDTNACGMYLETGKNNIAGNNLYLKADMNLYDAVNFYEWEVEK